MLIIAKPDPSTVDNLGQYMVPNTWMVEDGFLSTKSTAVAGFETRGRYSLPSGKDPSV